MLPPLKSPLFWAINYRQMTEDRCTRCDDRKDHVTKSSCKRTDACWWLRNAADQELLGEMHSSKKTDAGAWAKHANPFSSDCRILCDDFRHVGRDSSRVQARKLSPRCQYSFWAERILRFKEMEPVRTRAPFARRSLMNFQRPSMRRVPHSSFECNFKVIRCLCYTWGTICQTNLAKVCPQWAFSHSWCQRPSKSLAKFFATELPLLTDTSGRNIPFASNKWSFLPRSHFHRGRALDDHAAFTLPRPGKLKSCCAISDSEGESWNL